jgi:hypothetical protein
MNDPFMLRQTVRALSGRMPLTATACPVRVQHERIGAYGGFISPFVLSPLTPFVLSLSKERTGSPDMGRL